MPRIFFLYENCYLNENESGFNDMENAVFLSGMEIAISILGAL
jgi:hypothetical protein